MYVFSIRFEKLDSQYSESKLVPEKLMRIYDAVGIPKELIMGCKTTSPDHVFNITEFNRILSITEKLPTEAITEAISIIQEDSFIELLDFCVSKNCFTDAQATTLYDFTIRFENLDSNYSELDPANLLRIYDAIGIPEDMQQMI